MAEQVVARIAGPLVEDLGGIVVHPFESGDMFGPLAAGDRIGLHHQHGAVTHCALIDAGQGEQAEQDRDRHLGRDFGDKVKALGAIELVERLIGGSRDRLGEMFEILAREGMLDQRAHAVVARRIGGAQRGAEE